MLIPMEHEKDENKKNSKPHRTNIFVEQAGPVCVEVQK